MRSVLRANHHGRDRNWPAAARPGRPPGTESLATGSSADWATPRRSGVVDLVARLERGRPIRLAEIVDRLNALYLDWLFSERVVVDAIVQLSANWAADYRSTGGIMVEDGPRGASLTIENSTRVDPWIVRQAQRQADACREALVDFSRRERPTGRD